MLQEVSGSVRDAGGAEVRIIDCISRSNRAVNRDRTRSSVCGGNQVGTLLIRIRTTVALNVHPT
jgi:hypothetical protein